MNLFKKIVPILAGIPQFADSGKYFVASNASYIGICGPEMRDAAVPGQTLLELMEIILIHLPNDKASRNGRTRHSCQTFGRATWAGCCLILWQTTTDNPNLTAAILQLSSDEASIDVASTKSGFS
jgi:hypothetical protein